MIKEIFQIKEVMCMAILEKLGDFAKNVSDLAEDSLEMSRLNSQINSFKSDIEKSRSELADFYWSKFVTGEQLDEEAMLICEKIVSFQDAVRTLQRQVEQVKEDREAEKAERKAAKAAEKAAKEAEEKAAKAAEKAAKEAEEKAAKEAEEQAAKEAANAQAEGIEAQAVEVLELPAQTEKVSE